MNISEILSPDRVVFDLEVTSRKRVLESLGEIIASADPTLSAKAVFQELYGREDRLGSTGLGHGVALPHARLPDFDRTIAAFVRVAHGVDFAAPDAVPVDLFFALVVPSESTDLHLQILATVAGAMNEIAVRERLRASDSPEEVIALLTSGGAQL